MIMVADAVAGGEVHIAALCAELDQFYGDLPAGTPAERAAQVRDVLFGSPPLAYALVARDGQAPAGLAAYSFLWPAAGLSASLYLKELYVAEAYRRDRRRAHAHGRAGRGRIPARAVAGGVDHRHLERGRAGLLRVARR